MDSIAWLAHQRLQSVLHREYDWVFTFEDDAALVVSCLWRLIEESRIRYTSEDEGVQFGLPVPIDAAAELNRRIANALIESVELKENTLDIELQFDTGHLLQVLPDSSGYEAWTVLQGDMQIIAVGGGELAIFGGPAPDVEGDRRRWKKTSDEK